MAPLQLLKLHADILFLIFKKVPLEDKLHTLLKMPEFRPFMKNRASYLSSSAPFSLKYLKFLRKLRPGWYFDPKSGFHRMYLQINETTLHFSKFHFDLWNYRDFHRPNSHVSFHRESIESARNDFADGFRDLVHFSDDLLTFHMKGMGFIIVHYRSRSPWQVIYLSNTRKYMMRIDKPIVLTRYLPPHGLCNFEATLTRDKKLIVQCVDVQKRQCHVQELNPITFEITKDYQYLTWDGGDRIPLMLCSDYRLEVDGYLEGFRIYHHKHPHVQAMREIVDEQDEHLKKFLWRKN